MNRIVIDQTKIRISDEITVKPGSEFPRPLWWWQRWTPVWLDVSENADGHLVFEANGKRADGKVFEVTPQLRRNALRGARRWMADLRYLDFSDALVADLD
ncbi:hypothetical protein GCM10010400_49280 [Streptomyces aculeolatus]|uniref:hypothetical protein n=1 Tax=Streptomyces aculeolatus TaxID=270689 RepID=UPI001CED81C5|nr:hypothetical protein [Streptomyces aculeolatus]